MSKNIRKTAWYKGLGEVDKRYLETLVQDKNTSQHRDTILRTGGGSSLNQIFRKQIQDISDTRNIFKVLPQLAFPRKILVSSILSPGDLTLSKVIVENTAKFSEYDIVSQMNAVVKDLVDGDLKVAGKVSKWLDDALIMEGSHPIMLLPSSVVDAMMKITSDAPSMESSRDIDYMSSQGMFQPKGLLGVRKPDTDEVVSLESVDRMSLRQLNVAPQTINMKTTSGSIKLPIILTDNPSILAMSAINEVISASVSDEAYGVPSFETMVRYPDADGKAPKHMPADIRREFFRKGNTGLERVLALPTPRDIEENVNIGHPLEYHLPSDCVIPITSPGDPSDHRHYIVILDESGYPISPSSRSDYNEDIRRLSENSNDGSQMASQMLQSANETLGTTFKSYSNEAIGAMVRLNSTLLETEVVRSIMTGIGQSKTTLTLNDSVGKLMLARMLSNQRTIMLYVPAAYITYIAFEYDEIGAGKSILEDSKSMAAMLATLTVANIIGSVEAAIPGKNINIQLDPQDKDPVGTATFMSKEAMDLNFRRFPMGMSSTIGLAEELQMNSFSVSVTGHPAYPEVSAAVTPKETSHQPIDNELMDRLNEYMHFLFNVPPELIGSKDQSEFATTVVNNSMILLKTVIERQTQYNKHLSDYLRKYVRYSGVMVARFYAIIKEHKGKIPAEYKKDINGFIGDYIAGIRLTLPEPETDNLTRQIELMESFKQSIEVGMDAFLNEESLLIEGYAPEIIQSTLPALRKAYSNHVMRQYMRSRGILTDLDIFRAGDEENPATVLNDELKNHSKFVIKSVGKFIKTMASVLKPEVTDLKSTIKAHEKALELAQKLLDEEEAKNDEGLSDGDGGEATGDADTDGIDADTDGAVDAEGDVPVDDSNTVDDEPTEETGEEETEPADEVKEESDLPSETIDEDKLDDL